MGIILPAKGDLLPVEGSEAMVGDGHAMGVTAEIPEHLSRPAESGLGIDHPILLVEAAQQLAELFFVGQRGGGTGTANCLRL